MKRKIKIGFVAENAIGGVVYYILGQIKLLDPEKYDCSVYLFNFEWRNVTCSKSIFTEAGIACIELDISHNINKRKLLFHFANKHLRNLDVVVATSKYELTGYCLAKLSNPIILNVLADTEINITDVTEFQDVVDKIVPNSKILAEKLTSYVTKDNVEKIQYLPQAIPTGILKKGKQDSIKEFRIIFLGRFNSYKGADFLLQIGEALEQLAPDIRFNVVTNGIGEHEFKSQWAFNKTTTYYSNIPNDELQYLWAESHVMLMPSRNEGMPVALIEAMRLGVVPICSNLDNGIKELVIPGITGYLVNVGDITGFVKIVMELYANPVLRTQLSRSATELVVEKFNDSTCIERFTQLYNSLTQQQHIERKYPAFYSRLGKLDHRFLPNAMIRLYRKIQNGALVKNNSAE